MATVWGAQGTPGPTCMRAYSHQANERPRCRRRAASLTSFHSLRVGNAGGRLVRNVRTWPAMLKEKAQAAPTARPKVPMRRRGADCLVVVRHRLCRPTANETLVSHCRVVGIELRRRVCFFVALKRGNARGAKGAGHRHLARVNRQREEPDVQWKAAAFARWHEPYDARVSSPVL